MHLISTSKRTVLTEFSTLETKSIYQHSNGETTDFQVYSQQPIFVEVNNKSGLEILRIKEQQNQKLDIQRVRKLNVENVYCVACAKQSFEEMALGLSNGQVKLYNYKNAHFVHRFSAESNRNSVLFLDYNGSDEYLASVLENGHINIYGIKTKTKIDTFNIDGNSTLARFHPIKRFHLSVASYKGSVSVYDMQAKRKLFHSSDSHAAPCRDLCMSAGAPNTLISVGYDCVINIFDTRRKSQPMQLNYCHPLSTVALSDCATFFCVGDLKGELITYDMRNTKVYLSTKKVHDTAVTRVGFVANVGSNSSTSLTSTKANQSANVEVPDNNSTDLQRLASSGEGTGELPNTILADTTASTAARVRDSFCDFLDFQANKGLEKISSRFTMRRDSFDWEALTRKPSNKEDSRISLGQMGTTNNSMGKPNNSDVGLGSDSFDGKINGSDFVNTNSRAGPDNALRDRSNTPNRSHQITGKLVQIQEEQQTPLNGTTSGSDKENPPIDLDLGSRLQILPGDRNSTPNRSRNSTKGTLTPSKSNSNKAIPAAVNNDTAKLIAELRTEMNTRFRQLESEIKFNAEANKWQIFTQSANLWSNQIDNTEEIRDALGILLQTDPFVNEFLRLKQENEMLKVELQKLINKN